MATEQSLIIIKPDGVERGLIGEIINRLERRGLKFVAMKLIRIGRELAEQHYEEHKGKDFYPRLIDYITSSPVVVAVVEGPRAIEVVSATVGKTDPLDAPTGTIRGDLGMTKGRNLIHRSDKPETARREIDLYFRPDEILAYTRDTDKWIVEEERQS